MHGAPNIRIMLPRVNTRRVRQDVRGGGSSNTKATYAPDALSVHLQTVGLGCLGCLHCLKPMDLGEGRGGMRCGMVGWQLFRDGWFGRDGRCLLYPKELHHEVLEAVAVCLLPETCMPAA